MKELSLKRSSTNLVWEGSTRLNGLLDDVLLFVVVVLGLTGEETFTVVFLSSFVNNSASESDEDDSEEESEEEDDSESEELELEESDDDSESEESESDESEEESELEESEEESELNESDDDDSEEESESEESDESDEDSSSVDSSSVDSSSVDSSSDDSSSEVSVSESSDSDWLGFIFFLVSCSESLESEELELEPVSEKRFLLFKSSTCLGVSEPLAFTNFTSYRCASDVNEDDEASLTGRLNKTRGSIAASKSFTLVHFFRLGTWVFKASTAPSYLFDIK